MSVPVAVAVLAPQVFQRSPTRRLFPSPQARRYSWGRIRACEKQSTTTTGSGAGASGSAGSDGSDGSTIRADDVPPPVCAAAGITAAGITAGAAVMATAAHSKVIIRTLHRDA